jgi:hypothetical protein
VPVEAPLRVGEVAPQHRTAGRALDSAPVDVDGRAEISLSFEALTEFDPERRRRGMRAQQLLQGRSLLLDLAVDRPATGM